LPPLQIPGTVLTIFITSIKKLFMNQKIKRRFLMALGISIVLVACNQGDKKDEETKKPDSTVTAKPEVAPPAVPDAVTAAGNYYKVLADTMGIRMLEVTYKPGDSSAWHSHPDYALYAAEGGTATFYGKDGTKMENEMKTGMIMIRPAEAHSVKNTGKTTIKVILFEVNRPKGTMTWDVARDAAKVAGNEYKVAADTMGIRVLNINYKPGETAPMHSHPDQALYVIDGSKGEFTDKDGKKMAMEFKKGMAMILPGATHSVKNTGTTALKAILVEVSRPVK
jgi:quercetin dioxygenase-like cupin family protein